jgi:Holliday junction resolvase RusA-like endonuclease
MSLPFHCRVYGLPVAQGRPRAFRLGAGIRMHDPENSRDWKRTVQAQVIPVKPAAPFDCPLSMELSFVLPRPKSLPRKVVHHTKRPDIDNLFKAIADSLNGILYRDDSQIVHLVVEKKYGAEPGVEIRLYEMISHSWDGLAIEMRENEGGAL